LGSKARICALGNTMETVIVTYIICCYFIVFNIYQMSKISKTADSGWKKIEFGRFFIQFPHEKESTHFVAKFFFLSHIIFV
jgi:hypothetical protein